MIVQQSNLLLFFDLHIVYMGGDILQIRGIDISEWQGKLSLEDFKKIKDSNIDFIMIRCGYTTYGKSKTKKKDPYFENNYTLAKQLGIPVGTYYYSCATTILEGVSEAKFVLDIIHDKQFEYPIAIDTEDNHDIENANYAKESQASIGKQALTPVIQAFCDTLEQENYYVSIYASTSWFRNRLILTDLTEYDKWIAQWSSTVSFSEKYGMWQYSSKGSVDGISGNVDLDYAYKDYPAIMKNVGLNGYVKNDENSNDNNDSGKGEEDNNGDDSSSNTDSDENVICFKKIFQFIYDFIRKIGKALMSLFKNTNSKK